MCRTYRIFCRYMKKAKIYNMHTYTQRKYTTYHTRGIIYKPNPKGRHLSHNSPLVDPGFPTPGCIQGWVTETGSGCRDSATGRARCGRVWTAPPVSRVPSPSCLYDKSKANEREIISYLFRRTAFQYYEDLV